MECQPRRTKSSLILQGMPNAPLGTDENIFDECRNLVRVLQQNTESLDKKYQVRSETAVHIQTMGSSLSALADLINKLDRRSRISDDPDILVDGQGNTYRSVRSCDLDRISDK